MKMIYMVLQGEDLLATFETGREAELFMMKKLKENGPFAVPVRVLGVPEEEENEDRV